MKRTVIWWQARLPRERVLLACLATLLCGGLLQLSWQQAVTFRENARQQLLREQQALQVLPTLERALQLRQQPARCAPPDTDTLNVLAQQSGLPLRLMQQGERWILHAAVNVDFNRLVGFLARLESQHGLSADSVQLARARQHVRLTHLEVTHAP
ncbi:TPA: type II secretion system protein M [Enterobacter kobei]|nr:type II secretion system protein M [Enterobacter kobei]HDT4959025.1 type II secretion system protein M [Enterobacter kobei]